MRLFLAINLPDDVRRDAAREVAPLVASAPAVSWVRPELLHVTLKFLGERDESSRFAIERAVHDVASTARPFDVVLAGAGAFPNFHRPRVVWLGMQNAEPMVQLAQRIDDALAAIGEARNARPFRAHLTLGRVRRELPPVAAMALEREARAVRVERRAHVDCIDLMRSELSARGPAYSVVAALPLGRR